VAFAARVRASSTAQAASDRRWSRRRAFCSRRGRGGAPRPCCCRRRTRESPHRRERHVSRERLPAALGYGAPV